MESWTSLQTRYLGGANRPRLQGSLSLPSTVLAAGFTNTALLEKFGLDPKTLPMKPMSVEQCVSEGLSGLLKNRSRIVPGRLNCILNALVPASLARKMEADLLGKALARKPS
jgi:hypothetical protein